MAAFVCQELHADGYFDLSWAARENERYGKTRGNPQVHNY